MPSWDFDTEMNLPPLVNLCARISELAYDDHPEPGLLKLGFDLVRKYDVAETQAILVTDYYVAVLAFRDAFDFLSRKLIADPFYLLAGPPQFVPGEIPMDGAGTELPKGAF